MDIITCPDTEDWKTPVHHGELRLKKVERWTPQAHDQEALLTQLDLAVILTAFSSTAGQYVREYQYLCHHSFITHGNIQLIGSGRSHNKPIIALHIRGYLVPSIYKNKLEGGRRALHSQL